MTEITLEAAQRTTQGKNAMRKLREQGLVPGIVYGQSDPEKRPRSGLPVQMDRLAAEHIVHALRGSERMISLRVTGAKNGDDEARNVILKEVQITPTGNHLVHIDFHEIDISRTVSVAVEVRPVGTPEGVTLGGTLQTVIREIIVECLPGAIPEYLEADVTPLIVGGNFHVHELVLPAGIACLTPGDETLFVVSGRMADEVEEVEEELLLEGEEAAEITEGEAPAEGAEAAADGKADSAAEE